MGSPVTRAILLDQRGFTIVEALVAALLLVIGSRAVMTALAGARKATYRGEQSQVANDIAQSEIEGCAGSPTQKLAMTSAPGTSTRSERPPLARQRGNFALERDGNGDPRR